MGIRFSGLIVTSCHCRRPLASAVISVSVTRTSAQRSGSVRRVNRKHPGVNPTCSGLD